MQQLLQKFWSQTFLPMLSRPRRLQVAALCFRRTDTGCEVLLVTSRDTGRWVIPKGWPMEGKSSAESAAQEAWEEAGVRQGQFDEAPAIEVEDLRDDFPEVHERKRNWVSPQEAAQMVREPQLQDLLNSFRPS